MPVTREVFEAQCKRRFGTANPERMLLEHWEWMVRHAAGPHSVRNELGLEPNYTRCSGGVCLPSDPDWCFQRFGMSRTRMPDGRIICIAGEHEDWYDPDFCIYNDVIVLRPEQGQTGVTPGSGEVELYGYPRDVFPPTDFHSATLVGNNIYAVGRLGYQQERRHGVTPIFAIDTASYSVAQIAAAGPCPGWIYEHHASYDSARHAITVRGGKTDTPGAGERNPSNLAAHRLYLDAMRWEIISVREAHRRFLVEASGELAEEFLGPGANTLTPSGIRHSPLEPRCPESSDHQIDIDGVRVAFRSFYNEVQVFVEGELPTDLVDALLAEISGNLAAASDAHWSVHEVQAFDLGDPI